ncbi:unnamed protein product [Bathycoccus prasinos]
MFSLSTSLVPVARPTTTVSLRKNTNTNTKVNSTKAALKTAKLEQRKQRVDKRGVHIIAMAGKPERGSRPSAEVIAANPNAVVDGKLWVCQGCGYVYDGTKGPWAEEKRCPACGERRFALKSRDEMAVAIGGLIVSVLLFGLLFVIVKL